MNPALLPIFEALAQLIPLLFIAVLIEDSRNEYNDPRYKIYGFYYLVYSSLLFTISLSGAFYGLYSPNKVALSVATSGFSVALSAFLGNLLFARAGQVSDLKPGRFYKATISISKNIAVFTPIVLNMLIYWFGVFG